MTSHEKVKVHLDKNEYCEVNAKTQPNIYSDMKLN